MHPILSKASLREPDTERLNTMLRVALTPLVSARQACASCCSGPSAAWDGIWGTYNY